MNSEQGASLGVDGVVSDEAAVWWALGAKRGAGDEVGVLVTPELWSVVQSGAEDRTWAPLTDTLTMTC